MGKNDEAGIATYLTNTGLPAVVNTKYSLGKNRQAADGLNFLSGHNFGKTTRFKVEVLDLIFLTRPSQFSYEILFALDMEEGRHKLTCGSYSFGKAPLQLLSKVPLLIVPV